jgi:hypothetical protein
MVQTPSFSANRCCCSPYTLSRRRWGCATLLVTWFRARDSIVCKEIRLFYLKAFCFWSFVTWQRFVFEHCGTHSNYGCTPIFLSVNVHVNNASPLTHAFLELLAFSFAGHFEITLGHRHMFWVWPYGSRCPSYSGAHQNPIVFAIFHANEYCIQPCSLELINTIFKHPTKESLTS